MRKLNILLFLLLSLPLFSSNINLQSIGEVYTQAQTISRLDNNEFVVGRWDNTIEVIKIDQTDDFSPKLMQTAVIPSKLGTQMLAYLDDNRFVSSNNENSLLIWERPYEVGKDDKNCWLYKIGNYKITYLDSLNLKKDTTLNEIHGMGVALMKKNNEYMFFESNGEGSLWYGIIENDKLILMGNEMFIDGTGAVLACDNNNSLLLESSYNTKAFIVE